MKADEWEDLDYRDITNPLFIAGIRQLRANCLICSGFANSPLTYIKEVTSLKWCLSHAQYIPLLVFDFTRVEQLLTCLTDLVDRDYVLPCAVAVLTMNCRPVDRCHVDVGLFLMAICRFVHSIAYHNGWMLNDFKTDSFLEVVRLLLEVRNGELHAA